MIWVPGVKRRRQLYLKDLIPGFLNTCSGGGILFLMLVGNAVSFFSYLTLGRVIWEEGMCNSENATIRLNYGRFFFH